MEISGKLLRDSMISGANNMARHKTEVDELNVFPVPDGDTGTNMTMTISNALPELRRLGDDVPVSAVADTTASAMLRGARGNSGVILSLLFRGIARGLSGKATASGADFAAALTKGVESAYKSVMKPTEGTVLTVSREAAEAAVARAMKTSDIVEIFRALIEAGEASLKRTPELLPALKKAGVVDAGGMGFLTILRGMFAVIEGGEIVPGGETEDKAPVVVSTNAAGTYETDIEFTYCTEYIVLKKEGCDDALKLRAYLESIGDSVVVVDDDSIIKVHVHTEHPGNAIEKGITFGSLVNLKIENMKEQHKTQTEKVALERSNKPVPVKPEKDYGFVAVVNGAGLEEMFLELGADSIVRGGQTSNPSTEDILEAIVRTPARTVFVLPNNKNIIMAAEQAARLADREVIVLQTRFIPQGITALVAFDPTLGAEENSAAMTEAFDRVNTGMVTFAVRDSEVGDRKIKRGDFLGIENGRLTVVERDLEKTLYKVTKRLMHGEISCVTVFYGAEVAEDDAEKAFDYLRAKLGNDVEIVLANGGQPIYYYIVSLE
ncbi:MAG: DAK2 domain-containing protein [Bacteroides sp.]|nr:DAK2 domain-containing protein [Roseburia sp.]MCM1462911.1 DAK2 domain-containing protein [Bacteroides sp.]